MLKTLLTMMKTGVTGHKAMLKSCGVVLRKNGEILLFNIAVETCWWKVENLLKT